MKRQAIVLTITLTAVAYVLSGCASDSSQRVAGFPPHKSKTSTREALTVKTFGPPGQRFSGVLVVDGVRREIAGVTPAEYPVECAVVSGVVTNMSNSGEQFGIEISSGNAQLFTPSTDRVCSFRYHAGTLEVLTHL